MDVRTMYRCRQCGMLSEITQTYCSRCGANLSMNADHVVSGGGQGYYGQKKNSAKIWIIAAAAAVCAAALVVAGIFIVPKLMSDPNAWRYNQIGYIDGESAFGITNISREDVHSITFLNTLRNVPSSAVDISQYSDGSVMAWSEYSNGMYNVYVAGKGGVKAPENCTELFSEYTNAESIIFNGNFHTEMVTNMSSMFNDCNSLSNIDIKSLDTSSVQTMWNMFYGCVSLRSLDLSSFNTSNVTNMEYMFEDCYGLETINLSSFNTSNVENMGFMFRNCESLTSLNLSRFDTSNVTEMWSMFEGCESLTSLDLSNFDFSSVTDVDEMFSGCRSLANLKMSSNFSSNLEYAHSVFYGCDSLPEDVQNAIFKEIEAGSGLSDIS